MDIPRTARQTTAGWLAPGLLFLLACALYSINLDRLPHPDEIYHVMAARGILEQGRPVVAEGIYDRAIVQTWLVAGSFQLFGDGLISARLPSVLATAAVVALLFCWLRREAGDPAAWLAAGLYLISPFAVGIAQFCRFYALQTLAFMAMLWLIHRACSPGITWHARILPAFLAVLLCTLAVHLQVTTLVGMIGVIVWITGFLLWSSMRDERLSKGLKTGLLAGLILLGLATVAGLLLSGLMPLLWDKYRTVQLFNQSQADAFWFYHAWFNLFYPSLWPAVGLLALAALTLAPRIAGLVLVVFTAAFLLSSFAGNKNLRYLAYAMPLLFMLWGMGLVALWSQLRMILHGLVDRYSEQFVGRSRPDQQASGLARRTGQILLAGGIAFLVLANPAWVRTASLLADVTIPPEKPQADWPKAEPALAAWLKRADIVVTSEELGALYFLERFDVNFSPSNLRELAPEQRHEFGLDHRTGRPIISERVTLERIFDCYPTGLLVGPQTHWGTSHRINKEIGELIAERAQPLELPPRTYLRAYVWQHDANHVPTQDCQGLPDFSARKQTAG